MPDPAERFIDAVVMPLDDNAELQIAARQQLEESIAAAIPGSGDSLENAAEILEERDRSKFRRHWKAWLAMLTGAISAVMLGFTAVSVVRMWPCYHMLASALNLIPYPAKNPQMDDASLAGHLNPQQRLLLLGDTTKTTRTERLKGLWDSEPDNPAYYADYALAHLSERHTLPPDFLETGRKLDPDNGWFIVIAAGDDANLAIDFGGKPASATPGGVKVKPIKDAAKRDEALALIREASAKPRFESYQSGLLEKRIPLLPHATDTVDQCVPMGYLAELSITNLQMRSLGDLVAIQAADLAKAGDREGFQESLREWRRLTEIVINKSRYATLVEVQLDLSMIRTPLKAQQQAATDLGLPDEAARLKALDGRFESRKKALLASRSMRWVNDHASIFGAMAWPVISHQMLRPPGIRPEQLVAGRLADHAFAGRMLALGAWAVLALAMLAAALYSFRGSALTRRLSARLAELMKPGDHAWIIGLGVLLPALYYLAIYRLTPLGCRDWSLFGSGLGVFYGQFATMLSLMLVLPMLLARSSLNRRGAATRLATKTNRLPWIAVILAAAALPLFGTAMLMEDDSGKEIAAAAVLLGPLHLYWIIGALRALFSRRSSLLRRMTLSRLLLPAYASAMILMMLAMPIYHLEERHWFARDEIARLTAAKPSYTPYEYDATQALQEEAREMILDQP